MSLLIDVFICREDNYGYLVHDVDSGKTAAIDAPDAEAIAKALKTRGWGLDLVLITHHHIDHVEGIAPLKAQFGAEIIGPRAEAGKIDGLDRLVAAGDTVQLGETRFEILGTPGHTLGHIVYLDREGGHLFAADALFSMGVGRMFEGEPGPMWEGLRALRELPDATLLYCGHEYTLSNAKFALSIEPDNAALKIRAAEVERMRAEGRYTIPVSLGMEKATNPFLRIDQPEVQRAVGLEGAEAAEIFRAVRKAKDDF
ncbi:hydroxyacylglutathione hydrolase [Arsenicitalea aurantiaca]|uniref:Hydroxyacylglutathione hydrolase n=1 Tax=Arsenicitalea aurantiaca TaxID=1783274 RepID=A0A433X5T0_9HYPH|nr:hydroxyacylglutathione hydrolase [Arsenicitalea aurantiaca]RUT29440.1 hydroxyacylglutathione hydrolase [Arsenicitalea aurantiaca]